MIDFLFGGFGLMVGLFLTSLWALRRPQLQLVLMAGFCLRAGAALFHRYISPLPDGVADAISFERYAWNLAEQGFLSALGQFPGYGDGWGYPWLVSLAYALVDRSPLFMQSLSVIAGTACVLLAYRLANQVWDHRSAIKAAWVVALFPMLIMYSALTMREAFIVLAFLFALTQAVTWQEDKHPKHLFLALFGCVAAGFFHGPMLIGAIMLGFLVFQNELKRLFRALQKTSISPVGLLLIVLSLSGLVVLVYGAISIAYIGTIERGLSIDAWIALGQNQATGNARYPEWLTPDSQLQYLMLLPVRTIYLIGAPFPWDIRSLNQIMGLFDGILYLLISWLILRNLRSIWANPSARAVLLICVPMIVVYAIGVGNFGTGLRHRAKFIAALIVLAAPLLPAIRLPSGSLSQHFRAWQPPRSGQVGSL